MNDPLKTRCPKKTDEIKVQKTVEDFVAEETKKQKKKSKVKKDENK